MENAAVSSSDSLEKLLAERTDLWRGRRQRAAPALATGRQALDARLPGGGWPRGRLIELLSAALPTGFFGQPGGGELELLLPCLAELTRHGQPVVFIAPPLVPCPQAMHRAGLELSRLLIARARRHALWVAEECLKSGLCGAVVLWPAPGSADRNAVRRLQLAAEGGPAPAFLCYAPGSRPPPSLASLRLAIRAGGRVEILRSRFGETGASVHLHAGNHAGNRAGNIVPLAAARNRSSGCRSDR